MGEPGINGHMVCAAICATTATMLALMAMGVGPARPEIAALSMLGNLGSYGWIHMARLLGGEGPPSSGISDQERRIMDLAPAALYGAGILAGVAAAETAKMAPVALGLITAASLAAAMSAFHHANWRPPR